MNRQSSFTDSIQTKCRILVTTTDPSSSTSSSSKSSSSSPSYIQLPYNYTITQMKNLQTYLCSSTKIMGIDFIQKPSSSSSSSPSSSSTSIPNIKNKLIYIQGTCTDKQKGYQYQIQNQQMYQIFDWNIDICIPLINNNPRQINQQIKDNLLNNLIIIYHKQPIVDQNITRQILKECKIYYKTNCNKKQLYVSSKNQNNNNNKRKVMINRIPVGLLLPKLDLYNRQYILDMIAQDITNAITIMISSQMMYRVVCRHEGLLPIQNYYSREGEVDKEFMKLVTQGKNKNKGKGGNINKGGMQVKIEGQKQKISINNQPLSPPPTLIRRPSENKNLLQVVGLVCLLVFIVGGYAAIKLF